MDMSKYNHSYILSVIILYNKTCSLFSCRGLDEAWYFSEQRNKAAEFNKDKLRRAIIYFLLQLNICLL